MKTKIGIAFLLGFIVIGALCGCGTSTNGMESSYEELDVDYITNYNANAPSGDLPPMITLYDRSYGAPYMPVNELPDGYEYIGELTEEQANDTGLAGCGMYAIKERDSISDIYVYQECGTPIDENTLGSTKLQWAYVQWVVVK